MEEILTRRESWHKPSASRYKGTPGKTAESRKHQNLMQEEGGDKNILLQRFLKALFTKEKSGPLKVSKKELEDHLKATHTQTARDITRG